jgi:hypothetical protein
VGSPLDTIFGLPTHVLIVHATVVFLPLAVLGAIAIVVRRSLIHRLGALTVTVAAVGAAAAWVSRGSGEQLASRVGFPQPHVDYGDALPMHATAFFVVVLVYWLFARGIPGNRSRPWWVMLIGMIVIVGGLGLLWSTIITGHSGAEAAWGAIIENTRPGQVPAQ